MSTLQNTDVFAVTRGTTTYKVSFADIAAGVPLPPVLLYKGTWAPTATAPVPAGGLKAGMVYVLTPAGTLDASWIGIGGLHADDGQLAIWEGAKWELVGNSGAIPDATTTSKGIVQLADAAAVTAGTAGRVVDAKELKDSQIFLQDGTDAKPRTYLSKLKDVVSVKDFGAVGDGVADDTAAIQAAINAATTSATSKEVFFPSNNISSSYKTTAPLVATKPIRLRGDSTYGVTILATGLSAGQYILDCDNAVTSAYFYEIENLTLRSNNGSPNGLRLRNCSYTNLRNVQLFNVANGVVITGTVCFANDFSRVHGYTISGNTVIFQSFTGGGQHKFDGCTFTGDVGFSLPTTADTDGLCFVNCNFEQCVTNSLYIGGTCNGLSIVGCRTEGCDGNCDFQINPTTGKSVNGLTITGCSFTSDAGALVPILIGGAGGKVRGFSITGNSGGYAGNPNFVQLNGDGESGIIAGNSTVYSSSIVNAKRTGVVVFGNEYSNAGGGKNDEAWGVVPWAVTQATWTPIDGSGAGLTLTSSEGYYQRIANMIFFHGHVVYPTTSDGSAAVIGGLPFTILNSTATRSGAVINVTDSTATALLLLAGTTTLKFQKGGFTNVTNANMSGKTIYFSGFYRIA